jgi:Arc/MetJ family transcription regulator
VIPKPATFYDMPCFDSLHAPALLVAEFTRSHMTAALPGDGVDGRAAHVRAALRRAPV